MTVKNVKYLIKAEEGAVNSNKNVRYFITKIDVYPHTHPLYIRRCIDEQTQKLRMHKTHCSTVIAQWTGDLTEQLRDVKEKLDSENNWINSYRNELINKEKTLSLAYKLLTQEEFIAN